VLIFFFHSFFMLFFQRVAVIQSVNIVLFSGSVLQKGKKMVCLVGVAHPEGMPETYNGFYMTQSEIESHVSRKPRLPVFDEHDRSKLVGEVFNWVTGENGEMIVAIEIPEDTPQQRETAALVRSGKYKGLSLGCRHKVDPYTKKVLSSEAMEVSVCEEGDIEGTEIYTFHSKDGATSDPFAIKWEPISGLRVLNSEEEERLRHCTVNTTASADAGPFEKMAQQLETQLAQMEGSSNSRVKSPERVIADSMSGLITMTPDGHMPDIRPFGSDPRGKNKS